MKKIMSYIYKVFGLCLIGGLAYGVWLMFGMTGDPQALFTQPAKWFDPTFFQYNVLLALFAVLVVPVITIFYVVRMKDEKIRAIKTELSDEQYDQNKEYIHYNIDKSFRISNYIGSIVTLTTVVIFGVSIFLLFKPLPVMLSPDAIETYGVDFKKGANFLMMGPFMYKYVTHDETAFIARLMISLTAFMYGFAGAYTYLIGHMVRSYFTLDLVPNIFVSSAIRMMTGSILALVLSFAFADVSTYMEGLSKTYSDSTSLIPVFSFFIGFFPSRGLMLLTKIANKGLGLKGEKYNAIPLSCLSGMSQNHEIRLNREGFDNLDNMANACWLELALRTGFSYSQLRSWAGQAWLYHHMGVEDYKIFKQLTGISDADDLENYLKSVQAGQAPDWSAIFNTSETAHIVNKASIVSQLLPEWLRGRNPRV